MWKKSESLKFPPLSDKFSEGVFTKTQWLIDYFTYREHINEGRFIGITPQQYQGALGQNCSLLANRYRGSLLGLAAGDALGTSLEFQPRPESNVITNIVGGGPFKLKPGEWTDDTSMTLCLAHSLIRRSTFNEQDQMDLYVAWWKDGAFSSTGKCFDIGRTTASALQKYLETGEPMAGSNSPHTAGNGSLMRLAPVVLFYASEPWDALTFAGESSKTTHAATEAIDACRYFASLLLGALFGEDKETILSPDYTPDKHYWASNPVTVAIEKIKQGSYKKNTR